MSRPSPRRLAWSLWVLYVAIAVAAWALFALGPEHDPFAIIFTVVLLTYPTVGALIAVRQPTNLVGWLFIATGLLWDVSILVDLYSQRAIDTVGSLPAEDWAGWISAWLWAVAVLAAVFLLLLFPTGRLPSAHWRPVAWAVGIGASVGLVGEAVSTHDIERPLENPVAVGGTAGRIIDLAGSAGGVVLVAGLALSALSLLFRLRRAKGDDRQQVKWFAYAAALMSAGLVLAGIGLLGPELVGGVGWVVFIFGTGIAMPVTAALAILRYHLYDIDVVIRRTLVYGVLTATLVGAYLGLVLLLQPLFGPLTKGNDLAIAGSTLAVAALFRPARRRIQAAVDHRFYRRRYDAQRTLTVFAARLREEIELETLSAELRSVVGETMQPAHVSLWLRPPGIEG